MASRRLPLLLLIIGAARGAYVLPKTTTLANPRPTGSARVVIAESPCACPAPKGWDVSVPTLAAGLGTGYKLWRALPLKSLLFDLVGPGLCNVDGGFQRTSYPAT